MEKETKNKGRWVEGNVATQTMPVIIDSQDDNPETNVYTVEKALVKLMNDIEELKQLL